MKWYPLTFQPHATSSVANPVFRAYIVENEGGRPGVVVAGTARKCHAQTRGQPDNGSRCGRIQHRTRTRDTRDRNTAVKPAPAIFPTSLSFSKDRKVGSTEPLLRFSLSLAVRDFVEGGIVRSVQLKSCRDIGYFRTKSPWQK
jgi:hypothetical protein